MVNSSAEENEFSIEILEPKVKECYPGDTNRFTALVKNNKSNKENFNIDIDYNEMLEGLPTGWTIEYEFQDFKLSEFQSRKIEITITSNSSAQGIQNIYFNFTSKDNISSPPAKAYCTMILRPFYKPEYSGSFKVFIEPKKSIQFYYFNLRLKNSGLMSDIISGEIKHIDEPLFAFWEGGSPYENLDYLEQSDIFNLKVRIPTNLNMGSYFIELYANSTNDPGSNNVTKLEIFIERFADFIPYFENGNLRKININESNILDVEAKIINLGNSDDEFEIRLNSSLRFEWLSSITELYENFGVIKIDETGKFGISMEIYDKEIYGDYLISFEIRSVNQTEITKNLTLTILVEKFYGIELIYSEASVKNIKPLNGFEEVGIATTVKNTGNIKTSYLLKIREDFFVETPFAIEWAFNFYSDSNLLLKIGSIDIDAYSEIVVFLGIEIPTESDKREFVPADNYFIPIFGESTVDENVFDNITVPLNLGKINEIQIEYTGGTKKIDPDRTTSFSLKIKNMGNAKDKMNFIITDDMGWVHPIDEIYSEDFEAFEVRNILVNITVPNIFEDNDAEAGIYYFILNVKPHESYTWEMETINYEVSETYGCEIILNDKYKEAILSYDGTSVSFNVFVKNLGNSMKNIIIPEIYDATNISDAEFEKWDIFIENTAFKDKKELSISIYPMHSVEIDIRFWIPYGNYFNFYGMNIRAYPEGKIQNEAQQKTIWLNLTNPNREIRFTEESKGQNKNIEPYGNTPIIYSIFVENLGNDTEIVTLRFRPFSLDLEKWQIKFLNKTNSQLDFIDDYKIENDEISEFKVYVIPYEKADRDSYDIELIVESEIDSTVFDYLIIQTIIKRPDLQILTRDIILPEDVKEGDLTQISVLVSNVGDAKARDVEITFYTDIDRSEEIDSRIITIPKHSTATVVGDWDVGGGKYHITVVADEKKEITEINEENNRATALTLDVRPDLVMSDLEIEGDLKQGEIVTISFKVLNIGRADVRNIKSTLYIGNNKILDYTISSIVMNSYEIIHFEWKIPVEKNRTRFDLKIEIPTSYRGQDDPSPGNNKITKTLFVDEKTEIINFKMPNSDFLIFILITLICSVIMGAGYINERRGELAGIFIISVFIFSWALFWGMTENPFMGFGIAFIISSILIIPLNSDVKNYNRIRKQIILRKKKLISESEIDEKIEIIPPFIVSETNTENSRKNFK